MLIIRLRQQGANSAQSFRLVVMDKRNPRDGEYIEMLGWYNPYAEEAKNLQIDVARLQHWLSVGATISDCVKNLVQRVAPEIVQQMSAKKVAKRNKTRLRRQKK